MTEDELFAYCRKQYDEHGFEALTFNSLQSVGTRLIRVSHADKPRSRTSSCSPLNFN